MSRETIITIYARDNDLAQGGGSGYIENWADSRQTLLIDWTCCVRQKGGEDDSKAFGLSNWKCAVATS